MRTDTEQRGERCVACTDIIERNTKALIRVMSHDLFKTIAVEYRTTFRQFKNDSRGSNAVFFKDVPSETCTERRIIDDSGIDVQEKRSGCARTGKRSDADLTISVSQARGDGAVNVGGIDASGVDFGTIRISGDLGRIEAGDADFNTAGVDFLKVRSLGRFGLATQAVNDASLASHVAGDLGTFKVAGAIKDASLSASGHIGSVIVLGSMRGGDGDGSGMIHSTGGIGFIQIDGSIIGGAGQNSGAILSEGSLGTLIVGGSIQSGGGARSGSIRAGETIESIVVRGSILGNDVQEVWLSAGGVVPQTAGDDAVGIGRLRVVGDIVFAKLMAGYSPSGDAMNGDAQIGRILVDGNWVASTAVAGSIAGPDGLFGTVDDAIQFPHLDSVIASIAMIKIGGRARGTDGPVPDHFGFVAEQIANLVPPSKRAEFWMQKVSAVCSRTVA